MVCESCKKQGKQSTILRHISHAKKCLEYYGPRFDEIKKEKRREDLRILQQKWRAKNLKRKEEENKIYYNANKENLREIARQRAQEIRKDSDKNLTRFEKDIEFGPEFICVCCHSALNEKEVLVITEKIKEKIDTTIWDSSVSDEEFHDPRKQGRNFVCKSCFKEMSQNKKMPTKSRKNGLTVEKLPPELADLTELENQTLPFVHKNQKSSKEWN